MIQSDIERLSRIATRRRDSFLKEDVESFAAELHAKIQGTRTLVIGGGGTIGGAVVKFFSAYGPGSIHVVDKDENALANLVRNFRASSEELKTADFKVLPLDYGTEVFHRMLSDESPYDYVFNFAALKHVRSEKDIYSVLQMIDTNVLKQAQLMKWLYITNPNTLYFSVSTDKAANPVSLMGVTKLLMEEVIFHSDFCKNGAGKVTSARFANVAFSSGSLLESWCQRIRKNEPIPVPSDAKRFFISTREAADICILSSTMGINGHVVIPKTDVDLELVELEYLAEEFVKSHGFSPSKYVDESTAKEMSVIDIQKGRYPILVTPLNTRGEKPFEEFLSEGEVPLDIGLHSLEAVQRNGISYESLCALLDTLEEGASDPATSLSKREIVELIASYVPEFHHNESHRGLDDRL